jgi:hypothetical protein
MFTLLGIGAGAAAGAASRLGRGKDLRRLRESEKQLALQVRLASLRSKYGVYHCVRVEVTSFDFVRPFSLLEAHHKVIFGSRGSEVWNVHAKQKVTANL